MVIIKLSDVYLDINQSQINIIKRNTPKAYTLANGAEMVVPCSDKLDVITFSGYIYDYDIYNKINEIVINGNPVKFLVSGLNIPIDMFVLVEQFETSEKGGDTLCIEYSISLREYVSEKLSIVNYDSHFFGNISSVAPETVVIPEYYTVKNGDTLWAISKKFLGDGALYPQIVSLNSSIKNPNLIYTGQEIRIK